MRHQQNANYSRRISRLIVRQDIENDYLYRCHCDHHGRCCRQSTHVLSMKRNSELIHRIRFDVTPLLPHASLMRFSSPDRFKNASIIHQPPSSFPAQVAVSSVSSISPLNRLNFRAKINQKFTQIYAFQTEVKWIHFRA